MSHPPAPPGATESVAAERVLVLAPHYDDEVLGCGGLLAALTEKGASIVVLFLTDGSGGVELDEAEATDSGEPGRSAAERRERYRERRRNEAERAAEALGIAESRHLDIADGALALELDRARDEIERALLESLPQLVLVPSPLEVTPDHRAAFSALFEVLHPVRPGHTLYASVRDLVVFAYEVNHPGYPDLLVDVTDQVPRIEAAMGCYESQLERHDYLGAGLGLRRFRTATLPPGVEAAEGYRRLGLADFVTRSRAELARELGAVEDPIEVRSRAAVSVVVRTRDREELLQQALRSLAASWLRPRQVIVVNDGGASPELPRDLPFELEALDLDESRGRAGAANAGLARATGDVVGFLDDDDLVYPEHYATLVDGLRAAGVTVCYTDAAVGLYELASSGERDGRGPSGWVCAERRLPYSRDFDLNVLLLDNYIPFHTVLFERRLVDEVGPLDEGLELFEDWDFLIRLARAAPFHHLSRVTCEYRHFRGQHAHALGGRDVDRTARFVHAKARVLAKHRALLTDEVLAGAVTTLRRETNELGEENARLRAEAREHELAIRRAADEARARAEEVQDVERERQAVQQRFFDLERDFHRLNGELESLRGEQRTLQQELRDAAARLQERFDTEAQLRAVVEDQTQHLARTYEEIERLNRLIEEMETTRAWRLHQLLSRRRAR